MNKKILIIFSVILTIAFITRFYKLGIAPAGLYLDEAGQGYSAYSVLLTGKDEFGKPWPIVFRSFTDFKTPVYVYLIVPLIPLSGLTSFAVRFPSFLFSLMTFPILYLLLKEISQKKYQVTLPLLTCLLLAISPWHILFGRTNFECNVALFFLLAGLLSFYKSLKKPQLLILAAILFAIAIPAYHAQRIVVPLFILVFFFRYNKTLLSQTHKKYLVIGAFVGFIFLLPTLYVSNTPGFLARASGLNIFSQLRQKPAGFTDDAPPVIGKIINSPLLISTVEFLALYTSYFSPRNLFILGDYGPRSSYPYLSTFFIWQFPFYIYGLYLLIKKKDFRELKFFVVTFLLIAPIPAALTRDPYSSIRSLQMVIPLLVLIALGMFEVYQRLKKYNYVLTFLFLSIIFYSLIKLYSSAIILNEYYRGIHWNYGWEKTVDILGKTDQTLPVVVDNSRDEPYIQLAFFLKFDPMTYQKENFEVPIENYYTDMRRIKEKKLGRIVTRPINWEKDLLVEQYLIGDELAISLEQIQRHNLDLIEEIDYPDGSPAIRIVKTNP